MVRKFSEPKPIYIKKSARAIMLLHAYSGSPNDVRMLARFLEQANYTIYTPMFTGHGTIDPEDILKESADKWWEDVRQAIDFLKGEGFEKIAIFGLSMGGLFAMKALEEENQAVIGGGTFCSPLIPSQTKVPENFYRYAEFMLTTYSPESEAAKKERLRKIPALVQRQLKQIEIHVRDVYEQLERVNKPIFLAQAALDEMIPADSVFQVAQKIKQQKFTLQWYPKSGHVITVGKEHKEFERDVLSFIESLPWDGANDD
ncbi:alpha/beta hydrolase [Enterococcus camelliae]|uniref:Alpha/beta hydrolase n=1 Tax=Enterococcus camelliae TaxID=453959 RepID=A0ABW5TL40_9ENTE